jgi:hypothetical protein
MKHYATPGQSTNLSCEIWAHYAFLSFMSLKDFTHQLLQYTELLNETDLAILGVQVCRCLYVTLS